MDTTYQKHSLIFIFLNLKYFLFIEQKKNNIN